MLNIPRITPVILSGGYGTRLWPVSRPNRPKQLVALVGSHTLLQTTVLRVAKCEWANSPVIVTNEELETAVVEQLAEIGVEEYVLVLEPLARGTAPAAAIVALMLANKGADTILALLPADHVIAHEGAFVDAMKTATAVANTGTVVTFGVTPTAPETGYGYIHRGKPIAGVDGCYQIDEFVEKPDRETAERYLTSGDHFWNSGMFVFSASTYLFELGRVGPAMLDACRSALDDAVEDGRVLHVGETAFETCPVGSIDHVVMEQIDTASVILVDLDWNDVGAWTAVWEVCKKDDAGNVVFGKVVLKDVEESLIYNELDSCLEVNGVEGVVVAWSGTAIFIAKRSRSIEIGPLVPYLCDYPDELPVLDASVLMSDGIQVVKIGCQNIKVRTTPEVVYVSSGEADPRSERQTTEEW